MAKRRKIVTAGELVYDVIFTMPTPKMERSKLKAVKQISAEAMAQWNCKSAARELELRIASAFNYSDLVVTVTFDDEHLPETQEQAKKCLQIFFRHLRKHRKARNQELVYIYVPEGLHGDRRRHFHIFINSTGEDLEIIKSLWIWGTQIDLSYVGDKGYEGWATYLSKERREAPLNGKKMFVTSKNCPRPKIEYQIVDDGASIEAPPGAVDVVDSANRNEYASYRYLKYRMPSKVNKVSFFSGLKLPLTVGNDERKKRASLRKPKKKNIIAKE